MDSERLVPITIESGVKFYIDIGGRTFSEGPRKSVLFFHFFRCGIPQARGATHIWHGGLVFEPIIYMACNIYGLRFGQISDRYENTKANILSSNVIGIRPKGGSEKNTVILVMQYIFRQFVSYIWRVSLE